MPPEPRRSSTLYLPMVKRRHLPWRNCSAWKWVSRPSRTRTPASLPGSAGRAPAARSLSQVRVEALLVHHAALADQVQEFVSRSWAPASAYLSGAQPDLRAELIPYSTLARFEGRRNVPKPFT